MTTENPDAYVRLTRAGTEISNMSENSVGTCQSLAPKYGCRLLGAGARLGYHNSLS